MTQSKIIRSKRILTEEQLAALGSVVAESTYVETLVEDMIADISGLNKEQLGLFLSRAMFQAKLEILSELGELKLKSKKRKAEFAKIISTLKHNNSERVTAVHGEWNETKKYMTPAEIIVYASGNILRKPIATHSKGSTLEASKLDLLAKRISKGRYDLARFNLLVWRFPYLRKHNPKLSREWLEQQLLRS